MYEDKSGLPILWTLSLVYRILTGSVAMSCCFGEESREQQRINKEIERQLNKDKKSVRNEVKLLLLGKLKGTKSSQ
ncbi:unnamed protein product [Protopolystoma xenopodis]|uniref:Uncharacterized protein n=1 Tax=Protopolystoma xenopodis TaxID=117903 RepID=A0A3S5CBJ3_9PLAT|nr:unnamed protein product [Protopolystoma xenopodis]